MVGLGRELDAERLRSLAKSTRWGMYIHAESTAELSDAFDEVGKLIRQELIYEEF